MAETRNVRRFYLHKRIDADQNEDDLSLTWQAKQEAEPGTALAATFPHRDVLAAIGYTTDEDLDGADADELVRAGLTRGQAEDVTAALS